jgi:hypothetical protein
MANDSSRSAPGGQKRPPVTETDATEASDAQKPAGNWASATVAETGPSLPGKPAARRPQIGILAAGLIAGVALTIAVTELWSTNEAAERPIIQ